MSSSTLATALERDKSITSLGCRAPDTVLHVSQNEEKSPGWTHLPPDTKAVMMWPALVTKGGHCPDVCLLRIQCSILVRAESQPIPSFILASLQPSAPTFQMPAVMMSPPSHSYDWPTAICCFLLSWVRHQFLQDPSPDGLIYTGPRVPFEALLAHQTML